MILFMYMLPLRPRSDGVHEATQHAVWFPKEGCDREWVSGWPARPIVSNDLNPPRAGQADGQWARPTSKLFHLSYVAVDEIGRAHV